MSNSCKPKQYISNDVHDISVIIFTISLQQSDSTILLLTADNEKPKRINIFRTKLHILKMVLFRTNYIDTLNKLKHNVNDHAQSANTDEVRTLSILFIGLKVSQNMTYILVFAMSSKHEFHLSHEIHV